MRWRNHYLARGNQFNQLWTELGTDKSRKILFVLGLGFDPRCLSGITTMVESGAVPEQCMAVYYSSGRDNRNRDIVERAAVNRRNFENLIDQSVVKNVQVRTLSDDGRYVGGRRLAAAFNSRQLYQGFTDVVVDISALPPGLYFPLIGALLQLSKSAFPNLHVIVSDAPDLDSAIGAEGGERAEMMVGFEGGTDRASTANPLPVWAPLLGGRSPVSTQNHYEPP